ncbi:hypothetical protein CkaCkLH20_03629 [Colletotrichum karsti]|uniref:Cyanovirin-N domain-containing protein n=1 Tax=Colletotrichum karsti TaxID=1095194 RepID=A0A9P6LJU7_9PEZI|nr:uncharacterized protein CkaCkLH20_03629 [Colletotrichum karsti]KAF9878729.1 hypothetical protein CkaCkLH20_03629 [Colletotrichum karsti]
MKFSAVLSLPILLAVGALASFRDKCTLRDFDPTSDGNPTLYYECPLANPTAWPYKSCSKIHLNDCFVNVVGKLWVRKNGAFGKSCKDCSYTHDSGELKCSCENGGGGHGDFYDGYNKTSINVDEVLRFVDSSKVGCHGIMPGNNCGRT